MFLLRAIVIILLFSWHHNSFASQQKCHINSLKDSICYSTFEFVHPTQFVLGKISISSKIKKIEKMTRKGKIEKYLLEKLAPAIIGPDGLFYIIDRHHTSYSILNAKIPNQHKKLYLKIIHNWSSLADKDFIGKMIAHQYFWPLDEKHEPRPFEQLPKHINNLSDDPYRSLAWLVRKNGGFQKTDINFQEFYWGMFFKKQGIILKTSNEADIESVLERALELAKGPLAATLPGYTR